MKRESAHLLLGLAVGALGATAVRHALARPPVAHPPAVDLAAPPPAPPPPAPWVAPTPLDDAEAAARIAAWLADDDADLATLRALLPGLLPDRFQGLAEALLARKGGEARARFQEVFDAWVDRDPAAAAHWAGALPDSPSLNGKARRLLREQAGLAWARDDLPGALAWAHTLPDAGGEWGAAACIYGQLAERDPQRALSLARARGDDAFFLKAIRRIYDGWSGFDPAAALQSLGPQMLQSGSHLYNFSDDIGKWSARDPDAALRWMFAQSGAGATDADRVLRHLADNLDAAPVAAALLRLGADSPPPETLADFLFAWVPNDPSQAAAWIMGIKDQALRDQILQRATGMHSSDKPWETIDLVVLLPEGSQRSQILASRLAAWAKAEPDAALAWLKAHDEPAAAAAVQAQLIGQLARTDRTAALANLGTLAPGQEKRTATRAIAAAWAESSPAEAAAWLATATKSATEDYNHQDWGPVVVPWFKKDPATVRDWINDQQDARVREEAGTAWTIQLLNSPQSHAERAALVLGVRDEARQRQDMFNVGAHWFAADAEAARAWFEASPLPQAIKAGLIDAYYKPAR